MRSGNLVSRPGISPTVTQRKKQGVIDDGRVHALRDDLEDGHVRQRRAFEFFYKLYQAAVFRFFLCKKFALLAVGKFH